MGIENIEVLKDDPEHHKTCTCKECWEKSEAILNGTDEVAQSIPDSERRVKFRG